MSPGSSGYRSAGDRGILGRVCRIGSVLLGAAVFASCASPARHPPPCPAGALDVPARRDAIVARLASVPEGAALVSDDVRVCFGRGPSVLEERGVVVLDRALEEGEAAARLGHLLLHHRRGSPYQPGRDCDAVVARALDAEAEAHALELELRRALGAEPTVRIEMEDAFWAAPEGERVAMVRAYLEEHPDGAPGIDALASGYRARCERER